MSSVFTSQFNYCPLICMNYKCTVNNKINRLHKRAEAATRGILLKKVFLKNCKIHKKDSPVSFLIQLEICWPATFTAENTKISANFLIKSLVPFAWNSELRNLCHTSLRGWGLNASSGYTNHTERHPPCLSYGCPMYV